MNGIREELENLREASQTHRKRFLDMILILLRDVGDIGSVMGGQMNEQKVSLKPTTTTGFFNSLFFQLKMAFETVDKKKNVKIISLINCLVSQL